MKKLISIILCAIMVFAICAPAFAQGETYGIIHGGSLRMRENAFTDAAIIKTYPSGSWVEILDDMSGPFYHVMAEDGQHGYMMANYITVDSLSAGSWATIENGDHYVNLRSGPSTDYRIIGQYNSGTRMEVLEYGEVFSRVRINGDQLGYMSSGLVRLDGETVWQESTVEAANGGAVHLRQGPNTKAAIINSYPVGTEAIILVRGLNWNKVFIGGQFGYMMTHFLEANGQGGYHTGSGTGGSDSGIGHGAHYGGTPIGSGVTPGDAGTPIGTGVGPGPVATVTPIGSGASPSGGGIGTGVHYDFVPDSVNLEPSNDANIGG